MSSPPKKYSTPLVALLGLIAAAFLLFVGYSLGTVGGVEPFGDVGRTIAVATLALTFGYNLGLATKQKQSGGPEFTFYTWFFGAFVALTAAGSLASIATSGLSISNLMMIFNAQSFRDVMVLLLGTLFGSIAIASGFIDATRIRYFKRSFTLFSEYLGQGILFGYASIKVTGDLTIGLTASGVVIFLLAMGSNYVRTRLNQWRTKQRQKPRQQQQSRWPGFHYL